MALAQTKTRNSTDERKAEVVAVVISLAAKRSPALITTSDIAREMNLTQGAVFKHFPTKEAIWLAVMVWTDATLHAALESAAKQAPNAVERLRAVFFEHVRFVMQYPGVPRLIFSELQNADDSPIKVQVRSLLMTYRKLLLSLLTEAEGTRQLVAGVNKEAAASMFIGTMQGLVMQAMLTGSTDSMEIDAKRVFPLYLRAIGANL